MTDAPAPSSISERRPRFDRIAELGSNAVSRAPFFVLTLVLIAGWLAVGPFVHFSIRWVEGGAAAEGAITFLLVALLENSQQRNDQSVQLKLNAMAAAMADQMTSAGVDQHRVDELVAAVGLERRTSASEGH